MYRFHAPSLVKEVDTQAMPGISTSSKVIEATILSNFKDNKRITTYLKAYLIASGYNDEFVFLTDITREKNSFILSRRARQTCNDRGEKAENSTRC